jgi:hypothetical protein
MCHKTLTGYCLGCAATYSPPPFTSTFNISFYRNKCYQSAIKPVTTTDVNGNTVTTPTYFDPCSSIPITATLNISGRVVKSPDPNGNLTYCTECHHACGSCRAYSRSTTYGCTCPGTGADPTRKFATITPGSPPDYYCICLDATNKFENMYTCAPQCDNIYGGFNAINATCMLSCARNQIHYLSEVSVTPSLTDSETSIFDPIPVQCTPLSAHVTPRR